jgi:hypothetical protein
MAFPDFHDAPFASPALSDAPIMIGYDPAAEGADYATVVVHRVSDGAVQLLDIVKLSAEQRAALTAPFADIGWIRASLSKRDYAALRRRKLIYGLYSVGDDRLFRLSELGEAARAVLTDTSGEA